MNKDTGEIRGCGVEVRLTRGQAAMLARLPASKRAPAFAKAVHRFAQAHPMARPAGLTEEEWREQRNAAKAIRRARGKRKKR